MICVKNLTPNPQVIPHGGKEEELYLSPYGTVWLRNPEEWDLEKPEANGLSQRISQDKVVLVERNTIPRQFRVPDTTKSPTIRTRDLRDLSTIMLTPSHENAMRIINVEPKLRSGSKDVDKEYLIKRMLPILQLAVELYEEYKDEVDFPNRTTRLRAINRRIKQIGEIA